MIKIIIKKPGMILRVPGNSQLRTPCKILVDESNQTDVNFLVAELRKYGISFQFGENKEKQNRKKLNNKQIVAKDSVPVNDEKYNKLIESMADHGKSISRIEKILKDFVESGIIVQKEQITNKDETLKSKKKSRIDEDVDEFIPQINVDNIKIKGSKTTEKVVQSKSDYKNYAEKLKNVIKEKE